MEMTNNKAILPRSFARTRYIYDVYSRDGTDRSIHAPDGSSI